MREGLLLIISGPSGSGKGTVVDALRPFGEFALSISVTTRERRAGEEEGVHYFFRTKEEFEQMRDNGQLLEHASYNGNFYGTPLFYVEQQIKLGKAVILEIDVQGALQVKDVYKDSLLIFMAPPTRSELERRLRSRGTDDEDSITYRLNRAEAEFKLLDKYDYFVINDKMDVAVSDIKHITLAERLRPQRNKNATDLFWEGNDNA